MTSKIAPPLTPKTLLLVTEWHWSGCTSSQDAFFEEGKHLVGCVDSDTFAQHQMYNFKYAGCSEAESQPGTLVRLSLLLRVLLLPVLLFLKTQSLLIWKYLWVHERIDLMHCPLKLALLTLLNSHTSFSGGRTILFFFTTISAHTHGDFPQLGSQSLSHSERWGGDLY